FPPDVPIFCTFARYRNLPRPAPLPACGERSVRSRAPGEGRLHRFRLAGMPPHPDALPASGEREQQRRAGCVALSPKPSSPIPSRNACSSLAQAIRPLGERLHAIESLARREVERLLVSAAERRVGGLAAGFDGAEIFALGVEHLNARDRRDIE